MDLKTRISIHGSQSMCKDFEVKYRKNPVGRKMKFMNVCQITAKNEL